jgi:hypothetical protein
MSGAGVILSGLGGYVVYVDLEQSIPKDMRNCERIVVFVSDKGEFPGKYLRVLPTQADAEKQGFPVPDLFKSHLGERPVTVVAIKPGACGMPQLRTALTNMHWRERNGEWKGPKKKSPSRTRSSLEYARRPRYAIG